MDLENTTPDPSNDIVELKKSAGKALARRFFVVLGITLVVGLILTWIENRMVTEEPIIPID